MARVRLPERYMGSDTGLIADKDVQKVRGRKDGWVEVRPSDPVYSDTLLYHQNFKASSLVLIESAEVEA